MLLTIKANILGIHVFASQDPARSGISSIVLEAAREKNTAIALATDGHRIAIISYEIDDVQYAGLQEHGQITIPAEAVAIACKGRKAQDTLTIDTDAGTISTCGVSFAYDTAKVAFPDWRQIVPSGPFIPFVACVDGAYVGDFARYLHKALGKMDDNKHSNTTMSAHCQHNDNTSPIIYQAEASLYAAGIRRALCLIMPVRVDSGIPVCAPFDPSV